MDQDNTYDIKIIRSAFKICYLYIMSFLIIPYSFIKKKDSDKVSYSALICDEINNLRILVSSNDIQNKDSGSNDYVESGYSFDKYSSNNEDMYIDTNRDRDEFNNNPETYSIKTDSIGYYDLKSDESKCNDIHVNLKRKTIDLNMNGDISRIPMKRGQIIVTKN